MTSQSRECGCTGEDYCDRCIPLGRTPREQRNFDDHGYTTDKRLILPSGPERCDALLVGEAGGKSEHYACRPFVGKTGTVLNAYLLAAGLARPDIRVTNVFPYWTGEGNPDPTSEQIAAEEWRLIEEIKRCKPKIIGAVGRHAARWFLGDVTMDACHGVPYFSDRAPGCVIVPIYHMAHGFYDPDMAAYSQEDILRFAHYLKSPPPPRVAPIITVHEMTNDDVTLDSPAVDTEGLEDRPWGLSWSKRSRPNEAYVSTAVPSRIKLKGRVLFHHALHDLKILRSMGIDTRGLDIDDTMVKLFVLQLEPQALKYAAYRHLGLKMTEFEETVRPWFDKLAITWLEQAAELKYPKLTPIAVDDYAKRKHRLYQPQPAGRRIKNTLTSYAKDKALLARGIEPDKPVKLEKRWAELGQTTSKRCGESEKIDLTMQYQAQAESQMEVAGHEPFPDFSIFCVPRKQAVQYSGTDASATALLSPVLDRLIDEKGLRSVYDMDRRAISFVDRMQEVGMRVNVDKLTVLEEDLEDLRRSSSKKIRRLVGDSWFNPGSPDQVAQWLYSVKGLPIATYTDSGRGSTADGALQMLKGYHADDPEVRTFIEALQDYREAVKFLGTFVRPIFQYLRRDAFGDWRIHPNFRITRVVSGRLSAFDPNVLALPTRGDWGKRIREIFEARPGWIIISADYSQLELRVGAHYSRDRRMREAFENNEDLHALTASILFGVPIESFKTADPILAKLRKAQRMVAKIINFAVFYGITAKALLEALYKGDVFSYEFRDCERFILEWFKIYSAVPRFQKQLWAQAEKDGFVRTMFGRICYVPNIRVMDRQMQAAAQRLAANFPVQGTGSDTLKRAEIRLHGILESTGLRDEIWPWLQMHDELVMEVKQEREEEAKDLIETCMLADRRLFSVPITADAGVGDSWATAKG